VRARELWGQVISAFIEGQGGRASEPRDKVRDRDKVSGRVRDRVKVSRRVKDRVKVKVNEPVRVSFGVIEGKLVPP
jgi:hypothetical protein